MDRFIFIFTARFEESIAFSLREDGGNLPPPNSGSQWQIGFQTPMSESTIAAFRVDATKVLNAIRQKGFYIGKPGAAVLPFRQNNGAS